MFLLFIKDTTPTLPECSVSVKSPWKEASGRDNQTGDRRRFKTGTAMGTLRWYGSGHQRLCYCKRLYRCPGDRRSRRRLEFHEDPWVSFVSKKEQRCLWFRVWSLPLNLWSIWGKQISSLTRKMTGPSIQMTVCLPPSGDPGSDHRGWIRDSFPGNRSGCQICLLQVWLPFCKRYIRNIQKLIFYI